MARWLSFLVLALCLVGPGCGGGGQKGLNKGKDKPVPAKEG